MKRNNRNDGHAVAPVWRPMHSFMLQETGCWRATQKACAILQGNPGGQPSSNTTSWQCWRNINLLGQVWHRKASSLQVSLSCRCFITLTSTKKLHNQKPYNIDVKWWPRKCDTDFIRCCRRMADNWYVCKRMVSDGLTFETSRGIYKKKFNIEDWNLSNIAVTFQHWKM